MYRKILIGLTLFTTSLATKAQENSPYSRYGLGDIATNQHTAARGMGGMTAAFTDGQAVNTNNPASYANIKLVTYDLGFMLDNRTLKSTNPEGSFSSTNLTPSYITLAFPINAKKGMGMVIGVKPYTRVNYSILQNTRVTGIDSLQYLYEGNGGLNQIFVGFAKRWKSLSLGINGGYLFGKKETSTKTLFANDTVQYYKSLTNTNTTYGKLFFNVGLQYEATFNKKLTASTGVTTSSFLRLGAMGSIKQNMNAVTDRQVETFAFNTAGGTVRLDSITSQKELEGTIVLPASYTIGIMYGNNISTKLGAYDRWMFGVEYSATQWTQFRYYGLQDKVANAWMFRTGTQYTPDALNSKSFFGRSTYRLGFYTGQDYINADGNKLKVSAITMGLGFNLRKFRAYDNQFTLINTSLELGKRGSAKNNLTENFVKVSLGLSLSDVWFIKRKYD